MKKSFQDLDLSNAFLFAAALEDEETCRLILEIILERRVSSVKVRAEHSIMVSANYRSVRLDIFASDEMEVSYDVEMQNGNGCNLAKRSRLYQAQMDVASVKPGGSYEDLKPSYIIFICTFDPFGLGLYRYTFEQRCRECGMELGDGTCRIFLNTKGTNSAQVPAGLIHFLNYVEQSSDDYVIRTADPAVTRLHNKVSELKKWREMEERYMTFGELLDEHGRKCKVEGNAEGKAEAVLELLSECGEVPAELAEKLLAERDPNVLGTWLKAAAHASDVDAFREKVNI